MFETTWREARWHFRRWRACAQLRFHLAAIALIASRASAQETMYAIAYPGPQLVTLDPSTGVALNSTWIHHVKGIWSATASAGALASIDGLGVFFAPCHLISLNRADARSDTIGDLGLKPTHSAAIELDPTSGSLYGMFDNSLYQIDQTNGATTLIARVHGAIDFFTALAIDPVGHAYVAGTSGPRLYTLDLSTGFVVKLAHLGLGAGEFNDLAFDREGTLWGSYDDAAASKSKTGLYTIDLVHLNATMKVKLQDAYYGLAFIAAPDVAGYCSGKSNSAGCVPAIQSLGTPSASATAGFQIWATSVVNQQLGVLLWSLSGSASAPFHGGTLCVRGPVERTPVGSSHGSLPPTHDCSGVLGVDFNTYAWNYNPDPALHVAGTTVWCQWYARDSGLAPPDDVELSDALRFVVYP